MKRKMWCLLMLAAVPALGQTARNPSAVQPQNSQMNLYRVPEQMQTGCEVNVMKVSFERPARYMPVAANVREGTAPSLTLELKNLSTRKVRSVDLMAYIKVKDSIYDLDSTTREFPIHVTGSEGSQRLKLVESAVGFETVAVEQVNFADGTSWKPEHRLACAYRSAGSIVQAK
jgi:hypothetical protein